MDTLLHNSTTTFHIVQNCCHLIRLQYFFAIILDSQKNNFVYQNTNKKYIDLFVIFYISLTWFML